LTTKTINESPLVANTGVLPNFCSSQTVFIIIVVAELLAIVISLAIVGLNKQFFVVLASSSLFIQTVALLDAAFLCFLRRFEDTLENRSMIIVSYLLMQVTTLLVTFGSRVVLDSLHIPNGFSSGASIYITNLCISLIISAIIMRYFYVMHQWQKKQLTETTSKIAALQARIRPHFLFNSMNTIANLIHDDPNKAEDAVLDLADLYRATLSGAEMVTLEQELQHANGYLRIEKIRLAERLSISLAIEEESKKLLMPSMILQPLVENAVYHGIESIGEGGTLEITASTYNNRLEIQIRNPLGATKAGRRHQGNQIALSNIKQRLLLTYGKKAYLQAAPSETHYTVHLCIPI